MAPAQKEALLIIELVLLQLPSHVACKHAPIFDARKYKCQRVMRKRLERSADSRVIFTKASSFGNGSTHNSRWCAGALFDAFH